MHIAYEIFLGLVVLAIIRGIILLMDFHDYKAACKRYNVECETDIIKFSLNKES